MQIFFSGASSFTGFWFCKELVSRGHRVTALFSKNIESYSGLRKERIEMLLPYVTPIFEAPLGSEPFFKALESLESCDTFCHHASLVEGYQLESFDPQNAFQNNINGLEQALNTLKKKGLKKLIYTSTIFEMGDCNYGLSKKLSSEWLQSTCKDLNISFQKFIVANPFGPFEEKRFTNYLLSEWKERRTPEIRTPDYVRDNIPVTALAAAYGNFISSDREEETPSYYAGTQESFTKIMSSKASERWNLPCSFISKKQTDFSQPLSMVGKTPIHDFNEEAFWDQYLQ